MTNNVDAMLEIQNLKPGTKVKALWHGEWRYFTFVKFEDGALVVK